MPLQATSGAASYDAFGGGVAAVPNYIEDVFSTYLYTGNGSTQTITNGIDLSTKGGLVWIKSRTDASDHSLEDTLRTVSIYAATLSSNTTAAQSAGDITGFTTSGFSLRDYTGATNSSGTNYASWTFRKQPKFFDVVTYTGNGTTNNISHNLQSIPGCIIIKSTSASANWAVICRDSYGSMYYQYFSKSTNGLNSTGAATGPYDSTAAITSTYFDASQLQDTGGSTNQNGVSYVAYLFAHNAGGFGLTGTDNVISCGSFTTNGSGNATVSLGYEQQWLLTKCTGTAGGDDNGDWRIVDSMRGFPAPATNVTYAASSTLFPNTSGAESVQGFFACNSTGFSAGQLQANKTYIYIAIRRGPMKVPTSGTSVFSPVAQTNSGSPPFPVTAGFPVDSAWFGQRNGWGVNFITSDRLRGATNLLLTTSTNSEATNNSTYGPSVSRLDSNTQFKDGMTNASEPDIYWMFKRAPSFFDEVCYTGTGSATTVTHNLGVAPELIIIKKRSNTSDWAVLQTGVQKQLYLNGNYAGDVVNATYFGNDSVYVAPTSTVFSLGSSSGVNGVSGQTFVAYLFATCAGVSKVGSYTGTGTTKQVDCGFTGGARFVLIKRTDSTGDWYVWDSARGIVSGNDPYLLLNSTAAEVTSTDYIDTYSAGFEISSTAPAAINASGGTFIFLAIA